MIMNGIANRQAGDPVNSSMDTQKYICDNNKCEQGNNYRECAHTMSTAGLAKNSQR